MTNDPAFSLPFTFSPTSPHFNSYDYPGGAAFKVWPSGKWVDPLTMTHEDVDLNDIGYALSMICRYGGHYPRHYSVLEHSLRVGAELWRRTGSAEAWLFGVIHDATEAYLGDIVRPIKRIPEFAAVYVPMEERLWGEVLEYFGRMLAEHVAGERTRRVILDHQEPAAWIDHRESIIITPDYEEGVQTLRAWWEVWKDTVSAVDSEILNWEMADRHAQYHHLITLDPGDLRSVWNGHIARAMAAIAHTSVGGCDDCEKGH